MYLKRFYQNVVDLLSCGESIVLATIFRSAGAAPRSAGAKMVVRADGSIIGTVGGERLPIGIDIYAETPEEIAVSIEAELIKARVGRENV